MTNMKIACRFEAIRLKQYNTIPSIELIDQLVNIPDPIYKKIVYQIEHQVLSMNLYSKPLSFFKSDTDDTQKD